MVFKTLMPHWEKRSLEVGQNELSYWNTFKFNHAGELSSSPSPISHQIASILSQNYFFSQFLLSYLPPHCLPPHYLPSLQPLSPISISKLPPTSPSFSSAPHLPASLDLQPPISQLPLSSRSILTVRPLNRHVQLITKSFNENIYTCLLYECPTTATRISCYWIFY